MDKALRDEIEKAVDELTVAAMEHGSLISHEMTSEQMAASAETVADKQMIVHSLFKRLTDNQL